MSYADHIMIPWDISLNCIIPLYMMLSFVLVLSNRVPFSFCVCLLLRLSTLPTSFSLFESLLARLSPSITSTCILVHTPCCSVAPSCNLLFLECGELRQTPCLLFASLRCSIHAAPPVSDLQCSSSCSCPLSPFSHSLNSSSSKQLRQLLYSTFVLPLPRSHTLSHTPHTVQSLTQ